MPLQEILFPKEKVPFIPPPIEAGEFWQKSVKFHGPRFRTEMIASNWKYSQQTEPFASRPRLSAAFNAS